jgi:hypothetical protein
MEYFFLVVLIEVLKPYFSLKIIYGVCAFEASL